MDKKLEKEKRTLRHLILLKKIVGELEREKIFYSVLGGFAVDGHIGKLTRDHSDLDIAILGKDKQKIIKFFEGYKLFKNSSHKISFSKPGILTDFLLLKEENDKLKIEFAKDKSILSQERNKFSRSSSISNFNFNTLNKGFLIYILERFYRQHRKKKTKEDIDKLKNIDD